MFSVPIRAAFWFFGFFLTGALFFLFRERILLNLGAALALLVVALALFRTAFPLEPVVPLCLTYALLTFGYCGLPKLRVLTKHGDVSYGMYVYAFPIQQLIVHLTRGGIGPLTLLALAWPISYAVSFASWRLIEKPALGLKGRLGYGAEDAVLAVEAA